jgi:hypothetical protein
LSNTLFRVRAGVVAKAAPAQQAAAVVSGLLIGAEFTAAAHAVAGGGGITVIGSPALAQRYAQAASHFGCLARCSIRTACTAPQPSSFSCDFLIEDTMPLSHPAVPLVAILRGLPPADAIAVGEVLYQAGFRALEVPLNRPGALEAIAALSQRFPDALVGAAPC